MKPKHSSADHVETIQVKHQDYKAVTAISAVIEDGGDEEALQALRYSNATKNSKVMKKYASLFLRLACSAIMTGKINVEVLKFFINRGAKPSDLGDYHDCQGRQVIKKDALYIAIEVSGLISNKMEVMQVLLEAGANVNQVYNFGVTLLMKACGLSDLKLVELLLQRGADINAVKILGSTSLHGACISHKAQVVKLLFSKGAKMDILDDTGASPLTQACIGGDLAIITLLLEAGANINLVNSTNNTALHIMCMKGTKIAPGVISLLLKLRVLT